MVGWGGVVACLIIVSTPGQSFVRIRARFGQVGDQVGQVKDQVGQGQGQELDNNYPSASLRERNLIQIKFPFADKQFR